MPEFTRRKTAEDEKQLALRGQRLLVVAESIDLTTGMPVNAVEIEVDLLREKYPASPAEAEALLHARREKDAAVDARLVVKEREWPKDEAEKNALVMAATTEEDAWPKPSLTADYYPRYAR